MLHVLHLNPVSSEIRQYIASGNIYIYWPFGMLYVAILSVITFSVDILSVAI
jgi:hypothetical protein